MPHDPFYASAAWRRCRAAFLAAHPTCAVPGCGQAATHVDHRIPRRRGGAPFAWANLQGLCHAHHSTKTAQADGGFGRRPGAARLISNRCTVDGHPTDPAHPWSRPRPAGG